jgi:cell division septum initiation protein DivIVA
MPDFDETLRNTLVNAQRTADNLVREAKEEAERLRNEAEFQSNALLADARDQATEMTTEAVAHRERMLAEAAAERAKMLETAKDEAQQRVNAVEEELAQAHEAERSRLLEQIADLQHIHGLLQGDVSRFERHLEARRTDVKKALDELNAVLDDPELLRSREALEPAEIGVVDSTDYPPVAVEVVALDELEAEADAAMAETTRPTEAINVDELEDLSGEEAGDDQGGDDQGGEVDDRVQAYEPEQPAEYVAAYPEPAEEEQGRSAEAATNGGAQQVSANIASSSAEAPPPPTGDPFLDELRRVTTEEPGAGDPITDFLEDDQANRCGWFGRRK